MEKKSTERLILELLAEQLLASSHSTNYDTYSSSPWESAICHAQESTMKELGEDLQDLLNTDREDIIQRLNNRKNNVKPF